MEEDKIKEGVTYYYFKTPPFAFYKNENVEIRKVVFDRKEKKKFESEELSHMEWMEYIFKDIDTGEEYHIGDLQFMNVHKGHFGSRIFESLDDMKEMFEEEFEYSKKMNIKICEDGIKKSQEEIAKYEENIKRLEDELSGIDEHFKKARERFNRELLKFE